MKLHTIGSRASARGLTLIELVVVLAILVALAGLIIGNFPSLLKKASGSTSANTIQDIGRAISIRYTTKGWYPDGYDNIVGATLPTAAGTNLNTTAITAADVTALASIGVSNVVALLTPAVAGDATWSVSTYANLFPIAATTNLSTLKTTTPIYTNLVPNQTIYTSPLVYVFGLGKLCNLVGPDNTLLEAPTRTGASDQESSQNYYQRYCIAFLVDGSGSNRKARFMGVIAPTASGFDVTDSATKTYQNN